MANYLEEYKTKHCPFCGHAKTLEFSEKGVYFAVVCSILIGGCGGSSGYWVTKLEAVEKWNRRWNSDQMGKERNENTCQKSSSLTPEFPVIVNVRTSITFDTCKESKQSK